MERSKQIEKNLKEDGLQAAKDIKLLLLGKATGVRVDCGKMHLTGAVYPPVLTSLLVKSHSGHLGPPHISLP